MKAIPCPVSPEELHRLVHEDQLPDKGIAARFPGGTVSRVKAWRKRHGVAAFPRWARNEVIPIEGRLKSLLVGSMLGDGRLVRRTNATHYSERHCGAQQPYLEWKASFWGPWAKPIKPVPDKRGYSQVRMDTCAHAILNPWQEMFYADHKKGWKRLVPEVVDLVDEFALAIWYLDDGCRGWWPSITFGMDDESREVAWAIFEKFGLRPRWELKKGKTGEFHMEREGTALRFLDIIRPHVPECMKHKLEGFGFQGPGYQVREKVTREGLQKMATEGIPIRRMAQKLGVGAATVDRWLKKFGIEHPRKKGRPVT